MDGTDAPREPQTPLDAERERLRKQGYSETEISQILIARETGSQQSESPAHGAMTGVASNLAAGATYAKNFVPGMMADLGTVRDPKAAPDARSKATFLLAVKVIVVLVIAYVVLQEFSQLRSMTARSSAEACTARQKVLIDNMPMGSQSSPQYRQWERRWQEFQKDCVGAG